MGERKEGIIALFDIDGTLTPPRKVPHLHNSYSFLKVTIHLMLSKVKDFWFLILINDRVQQWRCLLSSRSFGRLDSTTTPSFSTSSTKLRLNGNQTSCSNNIKSYLKGVDVVVNVVV